jgi:hypothetical protein
MHTPCILKKYQILKVFNPILNTFLHKKFDVNVNT